MKYFISWEPDFSTVCCGGEIDIEEIEAVNKHVHQDSIMIDN